MSATIRRSWRLWAFLLLGFGPFVPSILEMRSFLLADNALGFTPLAIPAGLWLFWVRAHSQRGPSTRDILIDLFFIIPLIAIVAFILLVTPGALSWYFWLNRVDLAALAPWLMAVGFAFFGYQQMLQTWPAWPMFLFAWPFLLVRAQSFLTEPFVWATAWVGRATVDFLLLPFTVGDDVTVFTSNHLPADQNYTLVVGQLCSGTAVTIGWIILGAAMALFMRGSARGRIAWFLTGLLLAFVSNLVRVSVLLAVAGTAGRDIAVNQVHPVLGLVLFALIILVMLALIRPFGQTFDPVPRGIRVVWEPVEGGGRSLRVVQALAVVAALGVGVAVVQAQELNFIGIGEGAPTLNVATPAGILPAIEGWHLVHETEISWTDLFGRTSHGDVWSYLAPNYKEGDATIGVQTVVTKDKQTLDRYTIEQCVDFHRRVIEARRLVDLGHGVSGVLLHELYEGVPSSTLYWVLPVNVDGDMSHARVALFGDIEEPTLPPGWTPPSASDSSPAVARLGQALETAFDGIRDIGEDPRAETDRGLIGLAVAMIDTMVTSGGPGAAS